MLQARERHVMAQSHKRKMFVLERPDSLRVGPTPSLKLSMVTSTTMGANLYTFGVP